MNRLEARQRTIVAVGLAAVANIDITPAIGHAYVITAGYGYHNEGAALWSLFALDVNDGAGFRDLCAPNNLASALYMHLYSSGIAQGYVPCGQPLILRAGQALRFNAAALSGAHIATLVLFVDEYLGETPYDG
jgi:hypothetical protein